MSKSWFRKNHQSENPARIAEAHNVVARQDAYDRAKEATVHLLTALKQWPGFDSTSNIGGAVDHTLVNIDRLDDALDELRDQIDRFRVLQRSEHPPVSAGPPTISAQDANWREATVSAVPLPHSGLFTVELSTPGDQQ